MAGKRLLIVSVSAGHGHLRAAEALCAGVRRWFPEHEARHVDLMTLVPILFRKAYKDAYLKLVQKHPAIWGYLYARSDRSGADAALAKLRKAVESACNRELLNIIREYGPDAVVCTHFMPLQVLARWKAGGKVDLPVWTCVTDYVAHRFWLEPGQEGYFTAGEENARRMAARGLDPERVFVTGIPIVPEFLPPPDANEARRAAARRFGLDPEEKTVLLMGGGAGVGDMRSLAAALLDLPVRFRLVALAGNNRPLLAELKALAAERPGRLLPLGFSNEVHLLLQAADLVVTKPGGLTTAECLALGKPMLVHSPIPGQEEHNADFLLENGAAFKAVDIEGLLWKVGRLLEDTALLERLARNAASLGRPYAARDILSKVLARA